MLVVDLEHILTGKEDNGWNESPVSGGTNPTMR